MWPAKNAERHSAFLALVNLGGGGQSGVLCKMQFSLYVFLEFELGATPRTENNVQTPAINQALFLAAIIIGISITSGGIGNIELSTKAIKANTNSEYLWPAKTIR